MPSVFYVSAPGRENGLRIGLRIPVGETVSIGNVSYTRSETTFSVLNLAVNSSPVSIDGVTYAAGRALQFDLSVPSAITPRTAYIDFSYTTSGNTIRVDRLHLIIQDAVSIEAAAELTGASYLSRSSALDNVISQLGMTAADADLGDFTNRDNTYPTIADDSDVKTSLQSLLTAHERDGTYNVLDYGASNNGTTPTHTHLQACINAALAVQTNIVAGNGSSIFRKYSPEIFLPAGTYLIDQPLTVPTGGIELRIRGDGAVIKQGPNFPADRWMIEVGTNGSITSAPHFIVFDNVKLLNFKYGLRVGGVDNNVNLGKIAFINCDFIGNEDQTGFAVRIFNRSAEVLFHNCQWDNCIKALDVQSCDGVILDRCRMQIRRQSPFDIKNRDAIHGYFTVRQGKLLVCNRSTFNPNQALAWAADASYALYQNANGNSTDDSPDQGNRFYSCTLAHTAAGGQAFDQAYIGTNWKLTEQPANPLAWFRVADFPTVTQNDEYIVGDIVNRVISKSITGVASTDVITSNAHGFANGDKVRVTALTGGDGLLVDRLYYVRDVTTNTFKLAFVPGGTAVNFTSDISAGTLEQIKTYWVDTAHTFDTWTADSGNFTELLADTLSVWADLTCRDVLFGGESGGIQPVIWDKTPQQIDNSVLYQAEVTIQNCTIGNNRYGYTVSGWPCVVLLCKIPNGIVVQDNKYAYTFMVSADYWATTPPTMWEPWPTLPYGKPQETIIRNNRGSAFRARSTFDTTYEQYGPDWAPLDLVVPTMVVNNGAAIIPGCAKDRLFKTSPTARTGGTTKSVTAVDSTDTFTSTAHGLADTTEVVFLSKTGGSNLSVGTVYYVRDSATDTFKLAATSGGTALDLGSDISAGVLATSMVISRFIGVANGDRFGLWITDGAFQVADGTYIKGNGAFNPKTGGGVAHYFIANNTDSPPKGIAYEISRTDFQ